PARGPNPPTGRTEPNRQALVHSQPRSCRGSPRWVSSQSSTPASPSVAIIRLPVLKSPWTSVSATGAGWCSRSQRRPISSAGRGSAKPWYSSVSWPNASTCGSPGSWSGSIWWIRASTSPARDRLPLQALHQQIGPAEGPRPVVVQVGHGDAGRPRRDHRGRLDFYVPGRLPRPAARVAEQDEVALRLAGRLDLDVPALPARAARHRPDRADLDGRAPQRSQAL